MAVESAAVEVEVTKDEVEEGAVEEEVAVSTDSADKVEVVAMVVGTGSGSALEGAGASASGSEGAGPDSTVPFLDRSTVGAGASADLVEGSCLTRTAVLGALVGHWVTVSVTVTVVHSVT